mgnify:FL=1
MHDDEKRKVALKVLAGEHRKDREQLALMKHEYDVGKNLIHPNVLRVQEHGTDRDAVFVVMDFFDGPNLKQKVREGVDKFAHRAEEMIQKAADGLHYFHEQGWGHRDGTPDNGLANDGRG